MTTLTQTDTPWRDDVAVIGLVGLAHASSHFSHLLLPLMFPVFMKTFGLSYSELGFLMTVFLWCLALVRPRQVLWSIALAHGL